MAQMGPWPSGLCSASFDRKRWAGKGSCPHWKALKSNSTSQVFAPSYDLYATSFYNSAAFAGKQLDRAPKSPKGCQAAVVSCSGKEQRSVVARGGNKSGPVAELRRQQTNLNLSLTHTHLHISPRPLNMRLLACLLRLAGWLAGWLACLGPTPAQTLPRPFLAPPLACSVLAWLLRIAFWCSFPLSWCRMSSLSCLRLRPHVLLAACLLGYPRGMRLPTLISRGSAEIS